jgi:hypothetical protein
LSRPLIGALQQACRQKRSAARIYRALADRERDKVRQRFLLALAAHAERQAMYYAYRLKRLKASIPVADDGPGQRLWRWILIRCGVKPTLAWMERGEHRYRRLLRSLACARLNKLN